METLIRRRLLRRLIWVCTICLCISLRTAGVYALNVCMVLLWIKANSCRCHFNLTQTLNYSYAYIMRRHSEYKYCKFKFIICCPYFAIGCILNIVCRLLAFIFFSRSVILMKSKQLIFNESERLVTVVCF